MNPGTRARSLASGSLRYAMRASTPVPSLSDVTVETMGKEMKFVPWADNMSVPDDVRAELLADLASASSAVKQWLRPELGGEPPYVLTEGLFTARKG